MLIAALFHLAWRAPERAAPDVPLDSRDPPAVTRDESATQTNAPSAAAAAQESVQIDLDALWTAIDEGTVAELPAYKETVRDRVLVRIAGLPAEWRVGQRIAVPIPQLDETFTPVIERVKPGPNGTRSYIGSLTEVPGRVHRFTITVGPRNTFAHLSTPDGTYELVATGELGWLMPAANMDRHVDYSVPDVVFPEGPQYVAISRARYRAELITDDGRKLADQLERASGERISALDAAADTAAVNAVFGEALKANDPAKVAQAASGYAREEIEPSSGGGAELERKPDRQVAEWGAELETVNRPEPGTVREADADTTRPAPAAGHDRAYEPVEMDMNLDMDM